MPTQVRNYHTNIQYASQKTFEHDKLNFGFQFIVTAKKMKKQFEISINILKYVTNLVGIVTLPTSLFSQG